MTAGLPNRAIVAPHALLPQGWASDVLLAWDEAGVLTEVRAADAAIPLTAPRAAKGHAAVNQSTLGDATLLDRQDAHSGLLRQSVRRARRRGRAGR